VQFGQAACTQRLARQHRFGDGLVLVVNVALHGRLHQRDHAVALGVLVQLVALPDQPG